MGRKRRRLTNFGKVLREYAEEEGILGWTALARELTATGYEVSRTAVANWATGHQDAPREVLPCLEELLKLDEEKKQRLAYAFAWEQRL